MNILISPLKFLIGKLMELMNECVWEFFFVKSERAFIGFVRVVIENSPPSYWHVCWCVPTKNHILVATPRINIEHKGIPTQSSSRNRHAWMRNVCGQWFPPSASSTPSSPCIRGQMGFSRPPPSTNVASNRGRYCYCHNTQTRNIRFALPQWIMPCHLSICFPIVFFPANF